MKKRIQWINNQCFLGETPSCVQCLLLDLSSEIIPVGAGAIAQW